MTGWIDLDSFAGGGGASTGMRSALAKPVDIAINHSEAAIAMHSANHPETRHYCESIWTVDPKEATRGKRVRVAWFSPDCTHHSRAKGGQPRSKEIRGLADVVIDWAREVKPLVILLENVMEFADWGPLDEDGHPIKSRKGEDFRAWLAKLVDLGYHVEYRNLVASRYGAPTSRTRFYLVARRDGQRVRWPEPTHGEGTSRPVRTAAEIIDWDLPCPSIFARKKPLAEATLRRIAAGLRRYVIESADPFIVPVTHTTSGNRVHSINAPLRTVTTAKGGEFTLVTPYLSKYHGGEERNLRRGQELGEPLRTVDTENRFALVTPHLMTNTTGHRGRDAREPVPTITTGDHHYLVAPTLQQSGYGEREGQAPRVLDLHKPIGTIVGDQKHALVAAFLATHNGGMYRQDLDVPMRTITAREHITAQRVTMEPVEPVEAAFVEKFYSSARAGVDARAPLPSVTATGTHLAEVRAFLVKYYGDSDTQRQPVTRPLDVITTKARFGLVTVHGIDYQIVDIGLRMLSPRELFRGQSFSDDYKIDIDFQGRPMTKTLKIELAGNSVCPVMAHALAAANVHERWEAAA